MSGIVSGRVVNPHHQQVCSLLTDTIRVLCSSSIAYNTSFSIDGLIGITIDNNEVLLVNIKETIQAKAASTKESDGVFNGNKRSNRNGHPEDIGITELNTCNSADITQTTKLDDLPGTTEVPKPGLKCSSHSLSRSGSNKRLSENAENCSPVNAKSATNATEKLAPVQVKQEVVELTSDGEDEETETPVLAEGVSASYEHLLSKESIHMITPTDYDGDGESNVPQADMIITGELLIPNLSAQSLMPYPTSCSTSFPLDPVSPNNKPHYKGKNRYPSPKNPRDLHRDRFRCDMCEYASARQYNLKRHVMQVHNTTVQTMISRPALKKQKLSKDKSFVCSVCNDSFANLEDLKDHSVVKNHALEDYNSEQNSLHNEVTGEKCRVSFECMTCKQLFIDPDLYKEHMTSHEEDKVKSDKDSG